MKIDLNMYLAVLQTLLNTGKFQMLPLNSWKTGKKRAIIAICIAIIRVKHFSIVSPIPLLGVAVPEELSIRNVA